MELITPSAPWIPEDDLLLKNAVEAGASLESLAKGAVQFSRKYTVRELRDRWQSLLYDPDVSAEASASMVKLEQLGPKSSGNGFKGGPSAEGAAKRKVQSIRRQYYETRKKLRRQILNTFDMALQGEMNVGESIGDGGTCEKDMILYDESLAGNRVEDIKGESNFGFQERGVGSERNDDGGSSVQDNLNKEMNHLLVDNLVDYQNCSGLEDVGPSHSMPDVPLWKTIEDVSAPTMPVHVSLENKEDSTEEKLALPDHLEGKHDGDAINASNQLKDMAHAAHLSDSLLNFTNEDELIFINIDGKDPPDKSCYDNLESLLLSSPVEVQANNVPNICESQKLDTEANLAMPSGSSTSRSEVIANPLDCSHGDLLLISCPGNDAQSSAVEESPHCPELIDEFMYCTLNTEDPEIPDNDDIGKPIVVPSSVKPLCKEASYPVSSSVNLRNNEPKLSLKKEDRTGLVANVNSNHPPAGVAMRIEYPGRNQTSAVSRQGNNVNANPSHSKLVNATTKSASDGCLNEEVVDALASAKVLACSKVEEHKDFQESKAKSSTIDHEEDDDLDEEDNDIPYFSDVETMILEMDLSPTDQDLHANREVSRYQHPDTKRTIMRLEQCAQSFMQRAIASQGALAILYGHNLKQYIKKSEVILGRATDDVQVDIDLGREGRANKISRRQALIRMEANGSFIIKNLGKSSIFLNGKEVATGQLRGLNSSSLIEIRDMSFIFEINNKSVKRFLENVDKKSEDKNNRFTWLPDRGH